MLLLQNFTNGQTFWYFDHDRSRFVVPARAWVLVKIGLNYDEK